MTARVALSSTSKFAQVNKDTDVELPSISELQASYVAVVRVIGTGNAQLKPNGDDTVSSESSLSLPGPNIYMFSHDGTSNWTLSKTVADDASLVPAIELLLAGLTSAGANVTVATHGQGTSSIAADAPHFQYVDMGQGWSTSSPFEPTFSLPDPVENAGLAFEVAVTNAMKRVASPCFDIDNWNAYIDGADVIDLYITGWTDDSYTRGRVSKLDMVAGTALSVDLPEGTSNPYYLTPSADGTVLYVVDDASEELYFIQTSDMTITETIDLSGLSITSYVQLAESPDGDHVYLLTNAAVIEFSTEDGAVTNTFPHGGTGALTVSLDNLYLLFVEDVDTVRRIAVADGATITAAHTLAANGFNGFCTATHYFVCTTGAGLGKYAISDLTESAVNTTDLFAFPAHGSHDDTYLYANNAGGAKINLSNLAVVQTYVPTSQDGSADMWSPAPGVLLFVEDLNDDDPIFMIQGILKGTEDSVLTTRIKAVDPGAVTAFNTTSITPGRTVKLVSNGNLWNSQESAMSLVIGVRAAANACKQALPDSDAFPHGFVVKVIKTDTSVNTVTVLEDSASLADEGDNVSYMKINGGGWVRLAASS
jgi:hypothetical protein